MEKLAVIDLGSNSIRMSIFEVHSKDSWRQIGAYRNMIKLSEGMTGDMILKPHAQLRAITAILEYKQIMKNEGVTTIIAVATAAVRKAKNGKDFVALVKESTGIAIQVIDGETEASLDCLAVECQRGIICDIGGGSTEFIAIDKGTMLKPVISIPMGSRSITEMFLSQGEDKEALAAADSYISKHISELPWLGEIKNSPIVGIGGTLRALAKYHLKDYSKEHLGSNEISPSEIDRYFSEILQATPEERRKMPGIGTERSDIILGGLLILMHLKKQINASYLKISDAGLREGILFDFLSKFDNIE